MALKTMINTLINARSAYDKQLKELGKEAGKGISEALGEVLPTGFFMQWAQYTPYFNDGEPCEFRSGEPVVGILPLEGTEEGWFEELEDGYGRNDVVSFWNVDNYGRDRIVPGLGPENKRTIKARDVVSGLSYETLQTLKDLWESIPEDMLKVSFGDHTKVRIVKNYNEEISYSVDEYDHD
jgi:hypothetical protein